MGNSESNYNKKNEEDTKADKQIVDHNRYLIKNWHSENYLKEWSCLIPHIIKSIQNLRNTDIYSYRELAYTIVKLISIRSDENTNQKYVVRIRNVYRHHYYINLEDLYRSIFIKPEDLRCEDLEIFLDYCENHPELFYICGSLTPKMESITISYLHNFDFIFEYDPPKEL